jgi:peptidoglycan/LPS O-acetylase OafA/YrhL
MTTVNSNAAAPTLQGASIPAATANTLSVSHPKYQPGIDGLQAIAVLSVVVFHAFPEALPGGFVGVDVLFVISGFLISTIIFSNLERGRDAHC